MARKGVWAISAAVVLALLVVFGLPVIASTQIVRDSVASQMSVWSGYRVRLDDAPDIRVWPAFRAVLHDVTLADWDPNDPRPVIEAERIEIDLSALAALRGDVVFTKMRLIRPLVRLRAGEDGYELPAPQGWGKLALSVETARALVSSAPASPDLQALPSDVFGTIEFVEGRLIVQHSEDHDDLITSITGQLDWPALNRQASLSANGIWHGENVKIAASSAQPLILLGGGSAPVEVSLQSAPANATYKGIASFAGDDFVDGQIELTAPSLNRLIEWTHALTFEGNRVGPVKLSGQVTGDRRRLKFENTAIGFNGSAGKGLLDVGLDGGQPTVAGTLAFDKLDLRALLNTFNPFSRTVMANGHTEPLSINGFDFDLRLSSTEATLGSVKLSSVAAAVKVKDGLASFDVSDAAAFGGNLQFGMRADRTGPDDVVELRMTGEQIQTGQLGAALGLERLVPHAQSSFSAILKGTGNDLETVLQSADGSFTATFGKGTVPGLDMTRFLTLSQEGDFFPLAALSEGSLAIDSAELRATISKGIAQIDRADAQSGPYAISLDGLVPIAGRGLALYGTLAQQAENETAAPSVPLMFFVGGSWSAPFITSFHAPAPQ
nr:AsmA-like C-terminal region-containing protein [Nitratireductor luteus]